MIMKRLILVCLAVFSLTAISCKGEHKENNEHKEMAMKDSYQCPMDCEKGKTYDKEGQCPVCEMDLKKMEAKSEAHGHGHDHGDVHKHSENKAQDSKEGNEHQHKKGDGHSH